MMSRHSCDHCGESWVVIADDKDAFYVQDMIARASVLNHVVGEHAMETLGEYR